MSYFGSPEEFSGQRAIKIRGPEWWRTQVFDKDIGIHADDRFGIRVSFFAWTSGSATKQSNAPSELHTPVAPSTKSRIPAFLDSDYVPPETMLGYWMVPFVGEVEQVGKCFLPLGPGGLTAYQGPNDFVSGNLYFGTKDQPNPPFVSVAIAAWGASPYRGGTAWTFEYQEAIDLPEDSTARCYPVLL